MLGYTEAELRVRGSGYQFIHAADMLYCAENHVRSESCWCHLACFVSHLMRLQSCKEIGYNNLSLNV